MEVSLSEINANFLNELKKLEPFGNENPYPVFLARQITVKNLKLLNDSHLRFYAVQGRSSISAIAFHKAYLSDSLQKDEVNLIFEARFNVYQGVENVQLIVLGTV